MKKLFTILIMLVAMNTSGQWQPDVRLTNNPSESYSTSNWCIAVNENVVHIVWYDNIHSYLNYEIYYKRSTDGGINWGADTRLTNNTAISQYPTIAVTGSLVHVAWSDERDGNEEIYYKRSTDGGLTWGSDTRLTNDTARSYDPCISVSGSLVHIVWQDNRGESNLKPEVYYKNSTDAGIIWGTDTRLTYNTAYSFFSSIASSDSCVHIVWQDGPNLNWDIFYKRSTDGGKTWSSNTPLTNDISDSRWPTIAVSDSLVHVAWYDFRDGNLEIYYKRSTDGGVSWGADTRLTNNPAASSSPSIAVSGLNVYLVWYEGFQYKKEIIYKRSTDGGINWGTDTSLRGSQAALEYPSIALSGSIVHVVWSDGRDGNMEIYYKRNPTGNVGVQNISTEVPSAYSLSQNYPNPFNPVTNVNFSIVNSGNVKLVVFDIMGREVQTLVNEKLQPGTYESKFNASALTSGVYFYKLSVGDFSETKRMAVIK